MKASTLQMPLQETTVYPTSDCCGITYVADFRSWPFALCPLWQEAFFVPGRYVAVLGLTLTGTFKTFIDQSHLSTAGTLRSVLPCY